MTQPHDAPRNDPWLARSIMSTRGAARGAIGATHELTKEKQGKYHYTIGPYSEPVMTIKPGDRVVFWTQDCFEGRIKTEADKPSDILEMPYINPQLGNFVDPKYTVGAAIDKKYLA